MFIRTTADKLVNAGQCSVIGMQFDDENGTFAVYAQPLATPLVILGDYLNEHDAVRELNAIFQGVREGHTGYQMRRRKQTETA